MINLPDLNTNPGKKILLQKTYMSVYKYHTFYLPSLKYPEEVFVELLLLRVTRVNSPSLFTKTTSSEFGKRLPFVELLVIESVNCLGVNEPVLDRVTILRVSEEQLKLK